MLRTDGRTDVRVKLVIATTCFGSHFSKNCTYCYCTIYANNFTFLLLSLVPLIKYTKRCTHVKVIPCSRESSSAIRVNHFFWCTAFGRWHNANEVTGICYSYSIKSFKHIQVVLLSHSLSSIYIMYPTKRSYYAVCSNLLESTFPDSRQI
jgi:hypothetical protein